MSYLLDKRQEEARRRLALLARIEDPGSIACLTQTGVGRGWRCLEVGAGAGSIARWLQDRVGPGGHVVATDIDTTHVEPLRAPTLEVRRHDIASEELERSAFDLVHARNVLVHLPEREAVLEKLASAVRPGGFLLVEELDRVTDAADPTAAEPARELYQKVIEEIYAFVRTMGIEPRFGSRLFGLLRGLGFEELHAEGRSHVFRGHPTEPVSAHVAAFTELKERIVSRGTISPAEFDDFVALTRDPGFSWREGLTVASWGRKPAE